MKFLMLASLLALSFCGANPTVQVTLSGTTAFADANVKDVVFVIVNVPGANGGLDQNGDGKADAFIYPVACGSAKPAGCGYPAHSGGATIGDLPLNFNYSIEVQLRNSAGSVLHSGTASFSNVDNSPGVNIAVN